MTDAAAQPARRLLLVDGDTAARGALAQSLRGQGWEIDESDSAESALDLFELNRPNVVICDVILPQGSGLDLCAQVVAAGGGPVILTSAVIDTRQQQRHLLEQYGAVRYLAKPLDPQTLVLELDAVLKGEKSPGAGLEAVRPEALVFAPEAVAGGELGPFRYPLLLMAIFRARETGVLSLEREMGTRTIYFLSGVPVFIASANRQENLGRLLVDRGKITEEQYQKSIQFMQTHQVRQGEALVHLGFLTSQGLYQALQDQAHEKLVQGFGWDDGVYAFARNQNFLDKITLLELDVHAAVAGGIRRYYGLEQLGPLFEMFQKTYPRTNDTFIRYGDRLKLSVSERRVASMFRGEEAVRELAASPSVEIRDLLKCLALLLVCDMATLLPEAWEGDDSGRWAQGRLEEIRPPTKEDEQMRDIILENYLRISSFNYFQILGVKPESSQEIAQKQYEKLSAKYHPDNYKKFNLGGVAAKLEEIFLRIELAYRTLSSSRGRADYESFLKKSVEMVRSDLTATLGAEMEYFKAQELLDQGNYDAAVDSLRTAVKQNPLEAEYHTLLGVALFHSDPANSLEARSHMSRALAIDPNNGSALAELGRIYAFESKHQMARKHFEAALRVRPNDEAIKRDLAQIVDLEKAAAEA